jgi:hypothetical protein
MFPFVSVFLIADRHGVREVVGHEHAQDRVGSVGGLCPEHSAPQKTLTSRTEPTESVVYASPAPNVLL